MRFKEKVVMSENCARVIPQIVWYEGHSNLTKTIRDEQIARLEKQITLVKHPETKFEIFDYDVNIPTFELCYLPIWIRKVLTEAVQVEKKGFNAIVMGCFADPGVRECRQLVNIPVIGVGEVSMHMACMLGHKFSVLTTSESDLPPIENNAQLYGVSSRMSSLRSLDLNYSHLNNREYVKKRVINESENAIKEGAQVIVLGCTMLTDIAAQVQDAIGVPVVDPVLTAFKFAEMFVDLKRVNLAHKTFARSMPTTKCIYPPDT
jgi:allantoin racemase